MTQITGTVHSIETMGTVDGPGLRTVVFLQGCPLKCKFCHNIDCSIPDGGSDYTVEGLVSRLLKNQAYWSSYDEQAPSMEVKGGVTFSGGEPTVQHAFLLQVLQRLKQEHVHTAIDSCSVTSTDVLRSLVPYIDLFMLSIKHMDDDQHRWLTGTSNVRILSNIQFLDAELSDYNKRHSTKKQIRARFLVIPGLTDDEAHVQNLGAFVQKLNNLETFEILPYGSHGRFKWQELFGKYDLDGIRDATIEDVRRIMSLLEPFGIPLKGIDTLRNER
ncbi:MAG: radical SAM protein [Patescibacteria group bacterium]